MSNSIATQLILSAKEQLDEAIKQATSKIELLDNLLQQGLGEEQLKQVVEGKINDGTIGNAIFNQENIVNTKNLVDGSVTNAKIGGQLNTYTTKNATTRFREINVMDININTTENTISYNTKRTGSIYVNNTNSTIIKKAGETKSVALKNNTTFVLAYNPTTNSLDLSTYGRSLPTCIILAYIYYYNANLVRLALCGNDNSIAVYKDGTQIFDMQTEQSIFNHTANSKATIWNEWATTKIDKSTTPVPFKFNSTVYADGGMLVGRAGNCNLWNTYDNGKGGHAMQLFSRDKSYRFSVVLDDRLTSTGDNLPVAALHTWLTDGGKEHAFGWLHLGADMCGFVNGVDTGQETGIYVNPSMSIFNTPVIMKPQALVTNMPKGYEIDENGNYLYDTNGKRIPKDLVGIDEKNILQVNESNELCFHKGDTNKWYKVNMTEITE